MSWMSGAEGSAGSSPEIATLRLAVSGFAALNDNQELQKQNERLCDLLTVRLSQSPRFQLVERQAIDSAISEISLSLAQASKPAEAVRLGKMLRADWLLLGSLSNGEGANTVIVKIVDAQTGVIRDLTAITVDGTSLVEAVDPIAAFVEASARRTAEAAPRTFFGIGGFEDVSINNRYPDLRNQLRAALETHFRGTRYAVVERAMVTALLTELRLNLGGLTEQTKPWTPAQPAFLLVDGTYQAYQDEDAKVNLILRVQEIGGGHQLYSLKERPGKELEDKVAGILDGVLADLHRSGGGQTRQEEVATQLARGIARSRVKEARYWLGGYAQGKEKEKRVKNISEAIEAFETVLLLDPDNAEAKFYLGICLLDPEIGRRDAARDLFREIAALPGDAAVVREARIMVAVSYEGENDRQAFDLLNALAKATSDPVERAKIQGEMSLPAYELRFKKRLKDEEGIEFMESFILTRCEVMSPTNAFGQDFQRGAWHDWYSKFVTLGSKTRESAEAQLERFLPQVAEKHPDLSPNIWASYALWRTSEEYGQGSRLPLPDAVREHLRNALVFCRDQPEKIREGDMYLIAYIPQLSDWCVCVGEYSLGELVGEIMQKVSDQKDGMRGRYILDSWSRFGGSKLFYNLGYCHRALGHWLAAQAAFELAGRSNASVIMNRSGPWGPEGTRIHAAELAAECRQHLTGESPASSASSPQPSPPTFISLGEPVLTFGLNTVFDCDGDRIWLTDGYAPFVYDQRDQSLTDLDWPAEVEANVSCICHDEKTVWWGTHGSGLVEMDKQSRRCRVYTEKDGLLLNRITALAVGQGRLWIGFGTKRVGGVGFLDLPSRRFTGMTPELELKSITNANVASLASWKDEPPHGPVLALSPTPAGDLWLYAGEEMVGMKFYSLAQNQWRTIKDCRDPGSKCMVATSNYIAYGKCNYASGLEIYTIPTRQSRGVDVREWLPRRQGSMEDSPIEALFVTASGERVWYGARGFLARADLKTGRVEQICVYDDWFQRRLDGLQCAGDDLWVAADCKLYRVPNRVRETSAAAAR